MNKRAPVPVVTFPPGVTIIETAAGEPIGAIKERKGGWIAFKQSAACIGRFETREAAIADVIRLFERTRGSP